jgi:hypothetical protein
VNISVARDCQAQKLTPKIRSAKADGRNEDLRLLTLSGGIALDVDSSDVGGECQMGNMPRSSRA